MEMEGLVKANKESQQRAEEYAWMERGHAIRVEQLEDDKVRRQQLEHLARVTITIKR